MKIGIIGTGAIGQAFAKQAAKAGYELIISNSQGPESLKETAKAIGGKTTAGTVKEAGEADVIFLAVPWKHLEAAISGVKNWKGKIVIDPTNPIITPGFHLADLKGLTSTEVVAGLVPGARVVKGFNTLQPPTLASDPRQGGGHRVIFYAGNDDDAKATVSGIIDRMGFAGIDLGRLDEGGKLSQFPGGPLPTLNLIKL